MRTARQGRAVRVAVQQFDYSRKIHRSAGGRVGRTAAVVAEHGTRVGRAIVQIQIQTLGDIGGHIFN